jgi:hypothetical protein
VLAVAGELAAAGDADVVEFVPVETLAVQPTAINKAPVIVGISNVLFIFLLGSPDIKF